MPQPWPFLRWDHALAVGFDTADHRHRRAVARTLYQPPSTAVINTTHAVLDELATESVKDVRPRVYCSELTWSCDDLLSAVYLQFALLRMGDRPKRNAGTAARCSRSLAMISITATKPVIAPPTITATPTPLDTTLTPLGAQHPAKAGNREKRKLLKYTFLQREATHRNYVQLIYSKPCHWRIRRRYEGICK